MEETMGHSTSVGAEKDTFVPECEVLYEGGPDSQTLLDGCPKNPGHPTFIPVNSFTMDHLPPEIRTETVKNYVKDCCEKTVKIIVNYTSPNRPLTYPNGTTPYPYGHLKGSEKIKRCGTGFVYEILPFDFIKGQPCPCHLCKNSNKSARQSDQRIMDYRLVVVETAAHVIYDDLEARSSVFEMFYDSEKSREEGKVKILYGVGVLLGDDEIQRTHRFYYDRIVIKCATHDPEMIEILSRMKFVMTPRDESVHFHKPFGVIISHPHGRSKQITIGKCLKWTVPVISNGDVDILLPRELKLEPFERTDFVKCRLPESATKDRLIMVKSSNKQDTHHSKHKHEYGVASEYTASVQLMNAPSPEHDNILLLQPGVEHTFEDEITVKFPEDAKFIFQFNERRNPWVTCPPNTKVFINGGKFWFLSEDLEFNYSNISSELPSNWFLPLYRTYDVDTCPGSSGAPLLCAERFSFVMYSICHAGSLGVGINRSAIREY